MLFLTYQLLGEVGGIKKVIEATPDGFFQFFPDPDFHSIIHYFAAWITIGLGSIPQQDIFQRVMSAKDEKTAVRASYLSGLMYLTIGFIPLLIGLCGRMLYAEEMAIQDSQMVIPLMVLNHGSLFLQIMFFGAILSAILSTTSGAILAPATVIGENLIKPYFKELNDKQLLQMMRFSVVGVAICSAGMAMWKNNIYDLVSQSSALSLVSLFVPLTAGLYWKRASNFGALLSIISGLMVWLLCEWIETEIPSLIYGGLASWAAMIVGSYWKGDGTYEAFIRETTS